MKRAAPFEVRSNMKRSTSYRFLMEMQMEYSFDEVDGKRYHHILDTATGYPYDNGLLGVSIITDESVDGDGLSTTCFALGLADGMALVESLDNTEAVFITEDYELHFSSGMGTKIPYQVME